jgi:hypothetical protein
LVRVVWCVVWCLVLGSGWERSDMSPCTREG